jgi:protease-4
VSDVYGVQGPPPPPRVASAGGGAPSIIINNIPPKKSWLGRFFLYLLIALLIFLNIYQYSIGMQYYYRAWFRGGEEFVQGSRTSTDKIAIIDIASIITSATVRAPIRELEFAQADEGVKAIVLRVNSPGGEVGATDSLYQAVEKFKKDSNKPVIVWMEHTAASGAFWVSMAGNRILANELCTTGSIGVYMNTISLEGLLKEWKINAQTIKTGEFKDTGSLFRDLDENGRAELQKIIDAWFEAFRKVILQHRDKITAEELDKIDDGRVFMATEAMQLGLIDEIGDLNKAIKAAQDKAGVATEVRVVRYRRAVSIMDLLQSNADAESGLSADKLLELQVPRILAMPPYFVGGMEPTVH